MLTIGWKTFLLLAGAIFLSGCESGVSSLVVSPPVIDYSDEVQQKAATEIESLGPACPRDAVYGGCSAVVRMVIDYGWMRDKLRAVKP